MLCRSEINWLSYSGDSRRNVTSLEIKNPVQLGMRIQDVRSILFSKLIVFFNDFIEELKNAH